MGGVAHIAHFIALRDRSDNALIGGNFKAGNIGGADTGLTAQYLSLFVQHEKTGRFGADFRSDEIKPLIKRLRHVGTGRKSRHHAVNNIKLGVGFRHMFSRTYQA